MQTKLSIVKRHMAAGEWGKAISVASKFAQLGEHRNAILDAQMAYTYPHFLRQLKKCPAAAMLGGQAALIARFGE